VSTDGVRPSRSFRDAIKRKFIWQPTGTKDNLSCRVSFDVRGELSWRDFFSYGLPLLSFL
jgi:hypothetical protein